jgi:hypothetical protein
MQFVEYPVTHDKIVRVVDECLRKNFLCSLGDDMIITFETKQMVPSVCYYLITAKFTSLVALLAK